MYKLVTLYSHEHLQFHILNNSVFQIRDGSRVKNPTATITWPDTDEKENRQKYSYKLKYYNYERKQK